MGPVRQKKQIGYDFNTAAHFLLGSLVSYILPQD